MARIELLTLIRAPIGRCFDLARSVEVHLRGASLTGELAIGSRTTGLLALGDEVTFRARHFGIAQTLTSRITAFDPPLYFRDSMVRGAFQRFDHDHHFLARGAVTEMRDSFDFTAPLGPLGRLAETLVLRGYLRTFLERRNAELRRIAESLEWRHYLPPDEEGTAPAVPPASA